jgi:hypothetical protein
MTKGTGNPASMVPPWIEASLTGRLSIRAGRKAFLPIGHLPMQQQEAWTCHMPEPGQMQAQRRRCLEAADAVGKALSCHRPIRQLQEAS